MQTNIITDTDIVVTTSTSGLLQSVRDLNRLHDKVYNCLQETFPDIIVDKIMEDSKFKDAYKNLCSSLKEVIALNIEEHFSNIEKNEI